MPYADFDFVDSQGRSYSHYEVKDFKLPAKPFWQPLEESNGVGAFVRQQHITPFIGATARLYGYSDKDLMQQAAPEPKLAGYTRQYKEEANFALERTAELAVNDTQKMFVEYFDSKLTSIGLLALRFVARQVKNAFEYWSWALALAVTRYDATVLVWREKVRYSRVRPIAVVQAVVGDRTVSTYAGPGAGLQKVRGSDWRPYVRTMPHGEYPSGSACICGSFAEVMRSWTGSDSATGATASFPSGSSRREPGVTPQEDLSYSFSTWSEVADICSQSRLWGGLQFAGSLPSGEKLCSGNIAPAVIENIKLLIAGSPEGALAEKANTEINVRPLVK